MLREEATHTNFISFGLTRPGIEPTIYNTRCENANHYTTDAFLYQNMINDTFTAGQICFSLARLSSSHVLTLLYTIHSDCDYTLEGIVMMLIFSIFLDSFGTDSWHLLLQPVQSSTSKCISFEAMPSLTNRSFKLLGLLQASTPV